jgi:hypothetical protein
VVRSNRASTTRFARLGRRGYQWEFAGGVQHELFPRVSVAVNYYRRYTGGNETVTDNVNIGPSDYVGPFCIDADRFPTAERWRLSGL